MTGTSRSKNKWLTPRSDGRSTARLARRYCCVCGTQATSTRILKAANLCEQCASKFRIARDGRWACKGCGKIAPAQLERNKGFCDDCVCPACGSPDPRSVRATGLCSRCLQSTTAICTRCGREAASQVKRNNGLCDACASRKRLRAGDEVNVEVK